MSWFEDLSRYDYPDLVSDKLLAVGWLEAGRPFQTGRIESGVYHRLQDLIKDPWEPLVTLGVHGCQLCLYEASPVGSRNVFIPGDGVLYVCPELITHYMNAHGYRPPDEFCAAVLSCPPMRSKPYLEAILQNGGRELIRQTK